MVKSFINVLFALQICKFNCNAMFEVRRQHGNHTIFAGISQGLVDYCIDPARFHSGISFDIVFYTACLPGKFSFYYQSKCWGL
jgi:hypothetical protein